MIKIQLLKVFPFPIWTVFLDDDDDIQIKVCVSLVYFFFLFFLHPNIQTHTSHNTVFAVRRGDIS